MSTSLLDAIDTPGVTIAHMLLQVILPLEHLVLVTARADIAGMDTVHVVCAMPQKGVPSRVRLAAPDFLTPPSLVKRSFGVLIKTLEVLKLEPTFRTHQTLNIVIGSALAISQY